MWPYMSIHKRNNHMRMCGLLRETIMARDNRTPKEIWLVERNKSPISLWACAYALALASACMNCRNTHLR